VLLALNKVDKLRDKSPLLPLIERYRTLHAFDDCLPISARTGEGLDELIAAVVARLPEGPEYFPPDHITDQPERFLAAEIVREKILALTSQEVPHAVAVLVEEWDDTPRILRIKAAIYVEREGQKGILIGGRGAMLKRIGTAARQSMEALFGRRVFLGLFVKVRERWRDDAGFLRDMDWRSMSGVD
jgi:GTP-binding protein Era